MGKSVEYYLSKGYDRKMAEYFASGRKRITKVIPRNDFTLLLSFDNGETRLYDAGPLLQAGTVFAPFREWDNFRRVYLDEDHSVCWDIDPNIDSNEVWNNKVDLCPDSCYVETVVLLSHKKADSYIHIDVEFGEGEGKIPVDSIAKRAEAYKPKEKVTYKMIKEYIEAKYGFKVHTAYIAEVKRNLGLPMYDAPNAVEELKQPRKHPTPEKVEAIKDALRYFAVI